MSTLKLYQFYDLTAMTVHGPILAHPRGEAAIRQFNEILCRKDTLPGQYPQEFALLEIGEQNQDTGEIKATDPLTIYTGNVWLRMKDRDKPDGSSPANTNGAGEQPSGFLRKDDRITPIDDTDIQIQRAGTRNSLP